MINAKEAKELYDQSGAEVEAFLTQVVEPKVKAAAEAGKRFVFIYIDAVETYIISKPNAMQTAAMIKLGELGYVAGWLEDGERYVPRGLQDDDGDGPMHKNVGIQVGW